MRFVLDTNLLVSGVITAGPPRRLVDGAKSGEFELCTSEVLLAELLDVLSREKFAQRLGSFGGIPIVTAREAVERLAASGQA